MSKSIFKGRFLFRNDFDRLIHSLIDLLIDLLIDQSCIKIGKTIKNARTILLFRGRERDDNRQDEKGNEIREKTNRGK